MSKEGRRTKTTTTTTTMTTREKTNLVSRRPKRVTAVLRDLPHLEEGELGGNGLEGDAARRFSSVPAQTTTVENERVETHSVCHPLAANWLPPYLAL
jgi:hypothetical protein